MRRRLCRIIAAMPFHTDGLFRTRQTLHFIIGAAFTGAAGVVIILAALFPLYLALHIDYAPAIVSDTIIASTPADNAIALQNALGPWSFPFALMGGIMLTAMSGLLVGTVYASLKLVSAALALGAAS